MSYHTVTLIFHGTFAAYVHISTRKYTLAPEVAECRNVYFICLKKLLLTKEEKKRTWGRMLKSLNYKATEATVSCTCILKLVRASLKLLANKTVFKKTQWKDRLLDWKLFHNVDMTSCIPNIYCVIEGRDQNRSWSVNTHTWFYVRETILRPVPRQISISWSKVIKKLGKFL